MRDFFRRFALLAGVFMLSAAITALFLNAESTDNRQDMNDCSLPEVMISFSGNPANLMPGYREPMQEEYIRDSLTPIDTTRSISFVINPYDLKVTSLTYEIRSFRGDRVLENKKIKNLTKSESFLTADVTIQTDLLMNLEYSLQIMLETDKGNSYHYTRIISRSNLNTDKYVRFVSYFCEKCMDKQTADELSSYIEPENTTGGTNYAAIDIHSTISQISWGKLSPQIYKKGIPVIRDINETTASLSLCYQICAINDDGETEVYDVMDFFRMRYTAERIMLLDFSRETEQIFYPGVSSITADGLILGVRNRTVNQMTNEEGDVTAFVQAGDLWTFSPSDGKATRIFSFRRQNGSDLRDVRREHDIKLIRVDGEGNVDFVLYGYMNRGSREGYSGVCVYHYNNDQNLLEERVFIPSGESFEFLDRDLGALSYVSTAGKLYLLFAKKIYEVDLRDGGYRIVEEGIEHDHFASSANNAYAAWLLEEGENAGAIREIEFESMKTVLLNAVEGQQLRPFGFMNEDLVYGILHEGDQLKNEDGHSTEGISTLRLVSFDGTLRKEYRQEGLYITDLVMGSRLMEFNLSRKDGKVYKVVRKDNIMNNSPAVKGEAVVETIQNSRSGATVRLDFGQNPRTGTPLVISARFKSVEDRTVILDEQVQPEIIYYVYGMGHLDGSFSEPAKAIERANELVGVVLNRNQQYVWERGNKKSQAMLNLEDIHPAVLAGTLNVSKLQEALGEGNGTVLNLAGVSLENVLYEVSAGRPVIAKTARKTSVLLIGYDDYNVWIYEPATGKSYAYGMNDAQKLFKNAGNVYRTVLEEAAA